MKAEQIARERGGARKQGVGWMCLCPAHADDAARLFISDDPSEPSGITGYCLAKCEWKDVLNGLRARGLLDGKREQTTTSPPARSPVHLRAVGFSGGEEPPHSIESEQAVLGSLLLDRSAFEKVAEIVEDADFYRDDHRRIFRHVARLARAGEVADVVTVDEAIKASEDKDKTGGLSYLATIAGNTPSAHNVRRYAEIVREHAERRRGMAAALELRDRFAKGDLDDAEAELRERVSAVRSRSSFGHALDLAALSTREPQPPPFIVPDWLPCGYATLLAGHGGVGKSAIALHLAACIALGVRWAGLDCAKRVVLYLCCEDRAGILHWRLSRICHHLGISMADLAGRLHIIELVGVDAVLWERDPRTGYTETSAYAELSSRMKSLGAEVLIVDGIADTYSGVPGQEKRYVNKLVRLVAADTGAVLLIGHVNRATAANANTTEGYAGPAGWHNAARARMYLYPENQRDSEDERLERTGRLLLELQKTNHGKMDQSIAWHWDDEAHMFLGEDAPTAFDRKHRAREERLGTLRSLRSGEFVPAATTGRRTAYHVLAARPEFPESLRSGKSAVRRFWRHIEELRAMGHIRETSIRRKDRHAVSILELTPEGLRACGE